MEAAETLRLALVNKQPERVLLVPLVAFLEAERLELDLLLAANKLLLEEP